MLYKATRVTTLLVGEIKGASTSRRAAVKGTAEWVYRAAACRPRPRGEEHGESCVATVMVAVKTKW